MWWASSHRNGYEQKLIPGQKKPNGFGENQNKDNDDVDAR